jgi:hypothetical protein
MTPPPPMQRIAIGRTVIAIRTVRSLVRILALLRRLLMLRLAAGDEGRQPFHAFVVSWRGLRARLKVLRLVLWLILRLRLVLRLLMLRLMLVTLVMLMVLMMLVILVVLIVLVMLIVLVRLMRLLLRKERLLLRSIGLAGHLRLVIVVVVAVIGKVAAHVTAGLLLEIRLGLAKLFLRGGDQAKIMFGVLIIIFAGDRVPGALRITGQLEVFLGNMRRRASNFYVLSIGLVHSRQWVLMMMMVTTFAVATAHPFVLAVSHGLLFRNPLHLRRH